MTNKKDAIEELKYSIEPNQGFMECRTGTISEETIKLAIEALEKHIPKKPIKYDIDYSGNPLFRCPVCGDSWNSNEFGDGIEHCWTCGQAIDWSKEDA